MKSSILNNDISFRQNEDIHLNNLNQKEIHLNVECEKWKEVLKYIICIIFSHGSILYSYSDGIL